MKTSTKFIGAFALGLLALFFYKSNKENKGTDEKAPLDGLNVDVNPERLVDSIVPHMGFIPNMYKSTVASGVKRFIAGMNVGKQQSDS